MANSYGTDLIILPHLIVIANGMKEGLDGGGSDIHYSLKISPIIHLIKILAYSLK